LSSELARGLWKLRTAGSVEDLTKRYRRLCKLYHPDVHSPELRENFERQMQKINEEYASALKKFNIITYRNPAKGMSDAETFTVDLTAEQPFSRSTRAAAQEKKRKQEQQNIEKFGVVFADAEAARKLGSALATLKRTRTFFSLKGTDDIRERSHYVGAMKVLQDVHRRFPNTEAGQDALYYLATASCNIKDYRAAIMLFTKYRRQYPGDSRGSLFHFYAGLCHHHLENYEQAVSEYGYFLLSKPGPQYRHFVALVASFKESAELKILPPSLPYS